MSDCLTLLDDLVARAEAHLSSMATGSLCRPDGMRDAVKHGEGRVIALREVRRLMRRDRDPRHAYETLSRWERMRAEGLDWRAYRAGGVAVLSDVVAQCDRPPVDPTL